jgi:transposase
VAGFAQLVGFAAQWPVRVWAIEGSEGIGRHVAQRLLAVGEQVVDVPAKLSARIYLRKKQANRELVTLLRTTGTDLLDLHGIGPTGAARLLVEVGDITRFPDRGHFASWTGSPAAGTDRSTWSYT